MSTRNMDTLAAPVGVPDCARFSQATGSTVRISQDGEDKLNEVAHELEQLAEEIRWRGMRGHQWGEILPQWNRLRALERGLRWMIEDPAKVSPSNVGDEPRAGSAATPEKPNLK